jgi:hypothetical protein
MNPSLQSCVMINWACFVIFMNQDFCKYFFAKLREEKPTKHSARVCRIIFSEVKV